MAFGQIEGANDKQIYQLISCGFYPIQQRKSCRESLFKMMSVGKILSFFHTPPNPCVFLAHVEE